VDRRSRIVSFVLFGGLTLLGAALILLNLPSSFPFRNLSEAAPILLGLVVTFVGMLGVLGAAVGDAESAQEVGPDVGK
jgi:TRAP-type C4-dicarboxylate transport system permease large subunit